MDSYALFGMVAALFLLLIPCLVQAGTDAPGGAKPASAATKAANERVRALLDFGDALDFEEAARGFIAPLPDGGVIKNAAGEAVWDMSRYAFIEQSETAPRTVNPSLWRQSRLAMKGGLFRVVDRLYQVRNADLSNLTIIEGDTGLIVVDPLISVETARAALELYYAHRPRRPVVAVLYSHSHADHYGGVRGVVDEADVASGRVKIVAPVGFMEAAVTENVLAGTAMGRRAMYMYGNLLPASPEGQVGSGLGMTLSSGTITIIPPTDLVTRTGQTMNIDGVEFEFMLAPDTEAPAEMHWLLPRLRAVTAAENCCHVLHNIYTLRGAKIRDPLSWSKHLDQTITLWGDNSDVMYGMHHWPVWGKDRVNEMLRMGRDGYRFINDQTLRLANQGYGPEEIAERIAFPESLERHWAMRGYYGTLRHNAKGAYVKYLGWFDGNPANLNGLVPVDAAKKYVAYMGGADAVMRKAREDFDRGEYRWVAEVMNRVVFADPGNMPARELAADALEQMGYQAESGPWRNFYLTGALELRHGVKPLVEGKEPNLDYVRNLPPDLLFDAMAVRLNPEKAAGKWCTINFVFTDKNEQYALSLENCALSHRPNAQAADADATLTMPQEIFTYVLLGKASLDKVLAGKKAVLQGDPAALPNLLAMMDDVDPWFNIVTP
ncbi:alkyl/aryl-sulfatase [Desulfolutivibrio sulfoxidireducens]|uniref:alkyl/aryl-sulfatase n=1 Tax=Desulfolutivibrio sulfoxidireducens TaxID=2773299 RepID=UPI00159D9BF1|nr:alkyl sulfatase dimerization domain-containing protein [Desulfolutivibrio sulfoxidireducens]QLA21110.1 MBL fold metallo-hydrolase [Desulfolutivibrio sulfoxidireducens]